MVGNVQGESRKEIGMHEASEEDLIKKARTENRLLITTDKGFGALVFLNGTLSAEVILPKVTSTSVREVHQGICPPF
jgi:predicted nuclease of predicted toxin-antitoxin system